MSQQTALWACPKQRGATVAELLNTAILVVVDRLTKMTRIGACKDTSSAEDIARLFVDMVWKLHGMIQEMHAHLDCLSRVKMFAGDTMMTAGTVQRQYNQWPCCSSHFKSLDCQTVPHCHSHTCNG